MMRLQRVGRKNDPSYRIVVTDKRTGPKSNKHIAILGSYNPKMNHVQLKGDEAKQWIEKGVQLSPTVHNLLINEKVLDGKKVNPLSKKSPIVDPEAEAKKAEEEAAAAEAEKAETEAPEETPTEETADETPAEAEATPAEPEAAEEPKEETTEEAPATDDTPAESEEEKKEA